MSVFTLELVDVQRLVDRHVVLNRVALHSRKVDPYGVLSRLVTVSKRPAAALDFTQAAIELRASGVLVVSDFDHHGFP